MKTRTYIPWPSEKWGPTPDKKFADDNVRDRWVLIPIEYGEKELTHEDAEHDSNIISLEGLHTHVALDNYAHALTSQNGNIIVWAKALLVESITLDKL